MIGMNITTDGKTFSVDTPDQLDLFLWLLELRAVQMAVRLFGLF